ncbi:DUF975 family protein [Rummeliibacillus sp. NPDC094406]|uniref:DUF975 family protein n=1 Tax=Rummeliibacillus sp. NPDC094406 TaxID=3364511 RepID=UPI0038044226
MNIRISEIKRESLQSLKGNWGLAVLLTFIMSILFYVLLFMISLLNLVLTSGLYVWFNQDEITNVMVVLYLIIDISLIPLLIGVYWFYLSLVRENKPQISTVLSVYHNGKTPIKLIVAYTLQKIFVILWSLLLIIPGIIKTIAYSQTFYILRDHPEYTILEAISESRRRMNGFKWNYFLLQLSFIGWGILCLFSLGIGFLWLVPYVSTANATFYNRVIYNQDADTSDNAIIIEKLG